MLSFLAVLARTPLKVTRKPCRFMGSPVRLFIHWKTLSVSFGMLLVMPLSLSLILSILGRLPFSGWLIEMVLCSRSRSIHAML